MDLWEGRTNPATIVHYSWAQKRLPCFPSRSFLSLLCRIYIWTGGNHKYIHTRIYAIDFIEAFYILKSYFTIRSWMFILYIHTKYTLSCIVYHIYTYIPTYKDMLMSSVLHLNINTYVHTHACIYYTYIHTYTHTYTYMHASETMWIPLVWKNSGESGRGSLVTCMAGMLFFFNFDIVLSLWAHSSPFLRVYMYYVNKCTLMQLYMYYVNMILEQQCMYAWACNDRHVGR